MSLTDPEHRATVEEVERLLGAGLTIANEVERRQLVVAELGRSRRRTLGLSRHRWTRVPYADLEQLEPEAQLTYLISRWQAEHGNVPPDWTRRGVVRMTGRELLRSLGLRGVLHGASYSPERDTVDLVVRDPDLEHVEELAEAPIVAASALRQDAEAGAQYALRITVDGEQVDYRALDDPFHRTTVTLAPEDLRAWADAGEEVEVTVHVDGTRAALAHVFRPMDLTPNLEQPRAVEGAEATGELIAYDGPEGAGR